MSFLGHLSPYLTPVFTPVLLRLVGRQDAVGRKARKLLNDRNDRLLRAHGPASLADFDRRAAALKPGDICLDLGANAGIYTEKLAATGAEVHAFEPDPYCFAKLQARFAGRANVHLHAAAVADQNGRFLLRRTRDFLTDPDLQSTGSSIAVDAPDLYDDKNAVWVEVRSFVEVIEGLGRPVALVKMDIEGAEFGIIDQILDGQAKGRILPIGALFVETHERHFPARYALVRHLRRPDVRAGLPFPIDTYWP